jgi:hypothetical protein
MTNSKSQQTLKLRKWVYIAAISAIVLIVMISTMAAVVTSKKRGKNRQNSEALDNGESSPSSSTVNVTAAPAQAPSKNRTRTIGRNQTHHRSPHSPSPVTMPSVEPSMTPPLNQTTSDTTPSESPVMVLTTAQTNGPSTATLVNSSQLQQHPSGAPNANIFTATLSPSMTPTTAASSSTGQPHVTTFYAHGDIPYARNQTVVFEQQMRDVPADAEFVIHMGDLRKAHPDLTCVKEEYDEVAQIMRLSHAPVFIVIGDNDWTDCPNQAEGLQLWEDEFVGFESRYWNHTFDIQRQSGYPGNFAFTHKGTLFIGLNIVGGNVYDEVEWQNRLTDESDWTIELIRTYNSTSDDVGRVVIFAHANPNSNHDAYFDPVTAFIENELQNQIPILYLNGDGHYWDVQQSFYHQPAFFRIMVTGLGVDPLLKVAVTADGQYVDPQNAFAYDRRL